MPSVPGPGVAPLTLVLGDEELLVARAVENVLRAVRSVHPDAEVHDLQAEQAAGGGLVAALAPSLFEETRVVVVRAAQDLDHDTASALTVCAGDLPPEALLVVVHAGGAKGRKLADALRAAGANVVACPRVTKLSERLDFVRAELRHDGRQVRETAVRALLDAVGSDLRELAGACAQLLADTDGRIDEQAVHRYHRGKAEASGFLIADKAVEGDGGAALELLRWGLSVGTAPVLVTSALATGIRSIAKVAAAGRGSPAVLARTLGMPPWKIERTQRQARGWHPSGISVALRAVAVADGEVKGGGADAAYALERAVLEVVAAREVR